MTEVRLLNVPLENDYQHTIYFIDANEQTNYFLSKVRFTFTEFSYQRKDNLIRIPKHFDEIVACNYVMYKNAYYSDKWFYAFITDMKYINDGMTEVYIETDVMQTWLHKYTVHESFVEREHTRDDSFGSNTIPESLELGEYICNLRTRSEMSSDEGITETGYAEPDLSIVVGATSTPDNHDVPGTMYQGIYSGIKYYAFDHAVDKNTGIQKLNTFLNEYGDGQKDAIVCMFLAPKWLAPITELNDASEIPSSNFNKVYGINRGELSDKIINFKKTLDMYEPTNKKLLTYPYRYLLVSNNNGGSVVYHFEDFYYNDYVLGQKIVDDQPRFTIEGCLTPGCSIRLVPEYYKGINYNNEEGLNLGKFPMLNWTSDYYTNWITQNAVNVGVNLLVGSAQIIGGIGAAAVGGVGGAMMGSGLVGSGVSQVANTLGEVHKANIVPPQASGNINCGDIVTVTGNNEFHFYEMSIKKEYAEIIDAYFDVYGYKTNEFKLPNFLHRKSYWYTKTVNVNISTTVNTGMPQSDLQKIKDCYNNGITFWRSNVAVEDYTVDNSIV